MTQPNHFQGKPIKACIYIRSHVTNQELSLREQTEACQKYIEKKSWVASDIFCDKCGGIMAQDKPMLQLMIKRAESGCFDKVIAYSFDRLSRSTIDLLNLKNTFDRYNVELCSITTENDDSNCIGE